MRDLDLRVGRAELRLPCDARTVVLCDDAAHAQRMLAALAAAGVEVIRTDAAPRGTVADQFQRNVDADLVQRVLTELQLDEALLEWRPRDLGPLQRMVAATVVALVRGVDPIAFDAVSGATTPFEAAHLCGHLRRVAEAMGTATIAVIADAALITSAGTHLVVLDGDTVAEAGAVSTLLGHPASDALRLRLEATPIASPLAMQMRRVQRVATRPVNYAHTAIIELPTEESIALAGGDED